MGQGLEKNSAWKRMIHWYGKEEYGWPHGMRKNMKIFVCYIKAQQEVSSVGEFLSYQNKRMHSKNISQPLSFSHSSAWSVDPCKTAMVILMKSMQEHFYFWTRMTWLLPLLSAHMQRKKIFLRILCGTNYLEVYGLEVYDNTKFHWEGAPVHSGYKNGFLSMIFSSSTHVKFIAFLQCIYFLSKERGQSSGT